MAAYPLPEGRGLRRPNLDHHDDTRGNCFAERRTQKVGTAKPFTNLICCLPIENKVAKTVT